MRDQPQLRVPEAKKRPPLLILRIGRLRTAKYVARFTYSCRSKFDRRRTTTDCVKRRVKSPCFHVSKKIENRVSFLLLTLHICSQCGFQHFLRSGFVRTFAFLRGDFKRADRYWNRRTGMASQHPLISMRCPRLLVAQSISKANDDHASNASTSARMPLPLRWTSLARRGACSWFSALQRQRLHGREKVWQELPQFVLFPFVVQVVLCQNSTNGTRESTFWLQKKHFNQKSKNQQKIR